MLNCQLCDHYALIHYINGIYVNLLWICELCYVNYKYEFVLFWFWISRCIVCIAFKMSLFHFTFFIPFCQQFLNLVASASCFHFFSSPSVYWKFSRSTSFSGRSFWCLDAWYLISFFSIVNLFVHAVLATYYCSLNLQ